ncbi:serine/threonine-protein kinase ULK4 isoform X2 [Periophthalmus magnuspinnatus]|uniref:serine/threonine-protein kinase ULK4 isoform X2 n=1 Tax=Periophthalmus magnuspinnatus TaxID=409849 RepID=UPI002437015D|nr:serine/threonine-protein kinase ULK4 isoform X2 [Periophthalmus magnuspinnatus]
MENFILYEKLGSGSRSVVHKGRLKGSLNYVAIVCSDKVKRPEIINHVRLCHDFEHPNIVSFYEWYETSNHLWLVVELCTGGSLESIVTQDGYLPEDVVRSFGWGLVQGLHYIHEMGVVLSDLTPAKILLDNSGILKFNNFCHSKAEGETMEDFMSLLSTTEISKQGDVLEQLDLMRTKLKGSLLYKAPEVLLGSETNISTDIWALGCILHYMYTGKPPFYCDDCDELTDMILYKEPAPLIQPDTSIPPSENFLTLIKSLLVKNPYKRMNWPDLLQHSFWVKARKEEEVFYDQEEVETDAEEDEVANEIADCREDCSASKQSPTVSLCPDEHIIKNPVHSTTFAPGCRDSRKYMEPHSTAKVDQRNECINSLPINAQQISKNVYGERKVNKLVESQHSNKSMTLESLSDFRPKKGGDEDNAEAIFLLSSCINSINNLSLSECNPTSGLQPTAGTDIMSTIKALLFTDSDLTVTPIMDNPKILKSIPVRFDAKTLGVPAYSVEKLLSLNEDGWSIFLEQLCSIFEEEHSTSVIASPATPSATTSTTARSKLNLLCYLCCVVGHQDIANKILNSSLLPVLTQQIRHAPNWDVRSKVLRVLGLLALHCTELGEDSPVSEVVTTLTDLLRENLRNSKVKHFLLPPLGEFLLLITSQEKRGSPEGLWFVPAAAYTGLMRSLREGDDSVVHHMAAKAVENIATMVSGPAHSLVTSDTGPALWYLFTHSTVEAVRVTAISALCRLTRVAPAVFCAVIDVCGPAVILEAVGGAGARVQQHLLTALATALITSKTHTHHITQTQYLVLKALRCLESPSTVTRAKASLLLLVLLQESTQTLLYCCQHRLVMYLERDFRKATALRENTVQSGYLSQCLEVVTAYLSNTAPQILDEVLCTLKGVTGRRHPSTAQSRQLKQILPNLSIVLELLSSQVFRSQIVTEKFLVNVGRLLDHIISIDSNETNLASAVGAVICDALIRTSLSIVEVLSQHHALISPHRCIVVANILPPLLSLAFSKNVEWCVFVLQLLSELSLVLLVQDPDVTEEENTQKDKQKNPVELGCVRGESTAQFVALISNSLLPRYETLLRATEPVPLYALKLLLSMTEYSTQICRLIKYSTILRLVFQLITACSNNVTSAVVQNAVALLCNLSRETILDLQPVQQQGLTEVVVRTLTEAVLLHLDGGLNDRRRVSQPILPTLPTLLELLHNIIKQTSSVVRSALQSQRLSCPAVETEAAEKLLLANRPLSQVSTPLIHMLSMEHQEVWEDSLQCLSILVQLYGGEGQDCLSASCLRSFQHFLHSHMNSEHPRALRTALRIIKRLMQTIDTDKSEWVDSSEGGELLTVIQEMARSDRCHEEVVSLAAEILNQITR